MSKIVLPEYKCNINDFFSAKFENFEINVLKIGLIEARRDKVAKLIWYQGQGHHSDQFSP